MNLIEILHAIEEGDDWPDATLEAIVALLPKDDTGAALSQRPITVLSVIYRLWASTRVRDLIEWQEKWIEDVQGGFRPKHGPEQMAHKTALEIEEALISGEDWCGIHFDYKKYRNKIYNHL